MSIKKRPDETFREYIERKKTEQKLPKRPKKNASQRNEPKEFIKSSFDC